MSKSSTKSKDSGSNKEICQYCKYHENNPSWCNLKAKFTARKFTCDDFKRRKK